jgi:hypothetical protein
VTGKFYFVGAEDLLKNSSACRISNGETIFKLTGGENI